MPLSIWLSAFAVACALPLAWWAIGGARAVSPGRVRANLNAGTHVKTTDLRQAVLQQSAQERVLRPAASALAAQLRRITPAGFVDALERRLKLSGMSDRWTVEQMLTAKLACGLGGGMLGTLVFFADPSFARFLFLGIVAGICSFIPDVILSSRADDRKQDIERALADALDQVTVCVEAGLSFESALARVAQSSGPLAEEFGRVLQDIQIGIPRTQAFENLLERTDVPDLRGVVHAFGHAERYGIPIAQVLRIQAAELREKRRSRAEERAMKIPVKLVFPVVLFILPALLIVVGGPAVIRVAHTHF
jgi:tight adherence protein C